MGIYRRIIGKGIIGGCAFFTFCDVVGHPAQVLGSSMYPTLDGEDACWWNRDFVWLSTWGLHNCSPGTILTFTSPRNSSATYIKRVTATEGQFIRPRNRDTLLEIPKGHYWMEGDNDKFRNDSNVYGPVSIGLVKGRATAVIWPPNHWKTL